MNQSMSDFQQLVNEVRRSQAAFDFELARAYEAYRLAHLLEQQALRLRIYAESAKEMIREIENDYATMPF
jgi:hypothetical protein